MKSYLRITLFILCVATLFNSFISTGRKAQNKEASEVHSYNLYEITDTSRVVTLTPSNIEIYEGSGIKGETVHIHGRLTDDDQSGISGKIIELYWKKTVFAPLGSPIATPETDENGNFSYSDFQVPKTQAVGDAYVVGIFQGDDTYNYSESDKVLFSISAYATVLIDPSFSDGEEYNSTDTITVSGEAIEMFEDEKASPPRYVKDVEVSAFLRREHGNKLLDHSNTDIFGKYSISKSIPNDIAPREYRVEMAMEETEKYLTKPEYLDYREIVIKDDSFVDTSPPVPVITVDKMDVLSGNMVNFSSSSSTENVEITEYEWTFQYDDELKTYDTEDFSFIFVLPGEYEVILKLSDAEGNVGRDSILIIVYDDVPPTAMGKVPEFAYQGDVVELDGSLSHDNAGIVYHVWSFDCNGSSVELYGEVIVYQFDIPGEYNITLLVEDYSMNSDRHYFSLEIKDIVPPIPLAMVPRTVDQGEEVLFDASVPWDNTGVANYTWSFTYNGTTVMLFEMKSLFKFEICGDFDIVLTVTDLAGNSAEETYSIQVRDSIKPIANITGIFYNIEIGERVELDGTGSTDNIGIINWTWKIDGPSDIVTLYGDETLYTFKEEGSYSIILTVRDAANNQDSTDKSTIIKSNKGLEKSDDSSGLSSGTLFIILGIIVILIISTIVLILVFLRKSKQEKSTDIDSEVDEDQTTPEQKKMNPLKNEENGRSPICQSCGLVSTYFPEHNCHWCGRCQKYVSSEEKTAQRVTESDPGEEKNLSKPQSKPTQVAMGSSQSSHKKLVEQVTEEPQKTKRIVRKMVPKTVKSPTIESQSVSSSLDGWDL